MMFDDVFIISAQIELLKKYLENIERKISKIKEKLCKVNNGSLNIVLKDELNNLMRLRREILSSMEKLMEIQNNMPKFSRVNRLLHQNIMIEYKDDEVSMLSRIKRSF
ncbi:hypothetical protein J4526_00300 [Desulfurococcaceae archaeon MEX13E-LK6-19]|nr:hypothetical protein J4526_00300 [Desulfurococcaceae archaeon MEX13E-LK6-19]